MQNSIQLCRSCFFFNFMQSQKRAAQHNKNKFEVIKTVCIAFALHKILYRMFSAVFPTGVNCFWIFNAAFHDLAEF